MLTGLLLYRTNFYIVCFSKVFGCLLFNVLGVLLVVCKGVGSSSVSACAPNLIHIHFYFDVPVFLRLCSRSFQYRTRDNKDTELHLKKISCNHVIIKNNLMNQIADINMAFFFKRLAILLQYDYVLFQLYSKPNNCQYVFNLNSQ